MFKKIIIAALICSSVFALSSCGKKEGTKNYSVSIKDIASTDDLAYKNYNLYFDPTASDRENDFQEQLIPVGKGLESIDEKFIWELGDTVYRYFSVDEKGVLIRCVRVVIDADHTTGTIDLIEDNGSGMQKTLDKEAISQFEGIVDVINMKEPNCIDYEGNSGGFVCIEKYSDGSHRILIRPASDDSSKFYWDKLTAVVAFAKSL